MQPPMLYIIRTIPRSDRGAWDDYEVNAPDAASAVAALYESLPYGEAFEYGRDRVDYVVRGPKSAK